MGFAFKFLFSGFAISLLVYTPAAAEQAPQRDAGSLIGADVEGENWTVAPIVQTDGFVWLFTVKTSYGTFQVNGLHRLKDRVQELRALGLLEKMSKKQAFADAIVQAGIAPVLFVRDLVVDPSKTVGNFVSGVGKMFSSVVAGVQNPGGGRDAFFDSVSGITKAERDLALELRVDPYSDFTPLRAGLADVAQVTAAGSVPVSAAIWMMSGGVGTAVSSASTASEVNAAVYNHTSREVLEIVTEKLAGLGVDSATAKSLVDNRFYSPADEYAIVEALESLGASNSAAFVENAATADSYDVAKFNRYRAELLARESVRLGTIKSFVPLAGYALNRDASGRLVAAFPFDTLYWTNTVSLGLTRLSAAIADQHETRQPLFASVGALSSSTQFELKALGWETEELD